MLQTIINNIKKNFLQREKAHRNTITLKMLRDLDFDEQNILPALIRINGIRINRLSKEKGIPKATLYKTIKGNLQTDEARSALAEALEINREVLFP